ncbi:PREDICTED: ubiquitin carboxyl-terminal hydrolase MINDY-1-like isoform X2 [Branchiostoma belcheri]|uniref:Ubiquitin carboxyl-terminal hydrolase n=1 Tax=Branchiostoma belcheri TaxID=7741 RepID=A0A6P4Y120_BRABE|nr:PREDICTED: ubiquitin carboxyl-terminal hydrolase MINDY-1-like isoform X2 [Branchiostoma belcheri]
MAENQESTPDVDSMASAEGSEAKQSGEIGANPEEGSLKLGDESAGLPDDTQQNTADPNCLSKEPTDATDEPKALIQTDASNAEEKETESIPEASIQRESSGIDAIIENREELSDASAESGTTEARQDNNKMQVDDNDPNNDSETGEKISPESCMQVDPIGAIPSTSEKGVEGEEPLGAEGGELSPGKVASAAQSLYQVKWIKWKGKDTPIVTQNENGPCPLLALMNVLFMTWKVQLPPGTEVVTSDQLMDYLGDCILSSAPKNCTEGQLLNYEQNFHDAMSVFHKLQTGLDVNVKFTGVRHFEYTPECIVFDLLGIALYHGWLIDPQNLDIVTAVGNCSYNQLVEKIISSKSAQDSEVVSQGMMAEAYLESTASQLTYHGLAELSGTVKEGEFCVFFRNNHFSTMYKHKSELFLLVTDQGFLGEPNVVWETLSNVEGDSTFVDADFRTTIPNHGGSAQVPLSSQQQIDQVLKTVVSSLGDSFRTLASYAPLPQQSKQQMDQDYLVALTLQQEAAQDGEQQPAAMSDLELAKKLQEEEDARAQQLYAQQLQQQQQRQQQQQQAAGAAQPQPLPPQAQPIPAGQPPRKKEDKCTIL